MMMWGLGPTAGDKKLLPVVGWPLRSVNSQLPVRIEGHSGGRWDSSGQKTAKFWLQRVDYDFVKLEVTVNLAEGKFISLVVDTSDVDILDPYNLPDWAPESRKPAKPPSKPPMPSST